MRGSLGLLASLFGCIDVYSPYPPSSMVQRPPITPFMAGAMPIGSICFLVFL